MIEVASLVKYYGDRRVLHGISFSVARGRVCGFLGPNGSGKSTTMDILAGILGPSDGSASVCGVNVLTNSQEAKSKIGYLPDSPPLYEEMRVRDFVDYVARLHKIPASSRRSIIDRVLADCDVVDVSGRIIAHLSKGYKQRVALCAALVHQPEVLILDEPTEGLDPMQIVHIRHLIRKLSQDRTVIMSSHILSEVQEVCDEVIIINDGRIAAQINLSDDSEEHRPYLFSFANNPEGALAWFQGKEFVKQAQKQESEPNGVFVQFAPSFFDKPASQRVAEVNAELVQTGFSVAGIRQQAMLESLFFDAIKNAPIRAEETSEPAAKAEITKEASGLESAQQGGN